MADAGTVAGWAASYDADRPVRVTVRLPDIDWEVDDWAFEVTEADGEPAIVATVRGFDLDYPDPARRLRDFAERLAHYNFVD
jgi:hypothetical protein